MPISAAIAAMLSLFLPGGAPGRTATAPSLEEIEARDAAKIRRFDQARRALDAQGALIAERARTAEEVCVSAAAAVCDAARQSVADAVAPYGPLVTELVTASAQLEEWNRARAERESIQNLWSTLSASSSAETLNQALCQVSGMRQTTEAKALYDQIVRFLAWQAQSENPPRLPLEIVRGYQSRSCTADVTRDCWRNDGGVLSYVSASGIRISSGCIFRDNHPSNAANWGSFPTDPEDFLEAAGAAASQITGCFNGINSGAAGRLARRIGAGGIVIGCYPRACGAELASTTPGDNVIGLVCPGQDPRELGRTFFHEMLHASGEVDNFHGANALRHNEPRCARFDAVYHCTEICMRERPGRRPPWFSRTGCRACRGSDSGCPAPAASLAQDIIDDANYCGVSL